MTHNAPAPLFLLLVLSLAAVPIQAGAAQGSTDSAPSSSQAAASKPSHADKTFVSKAAADGLAEVESGKLAQQKTSSDDVRQVAQKMIDDHSQANEKLQALASQKNLDLPKQPDSAARKQMSRLESMSGPKFDKAFIKNEEQDHKKAIALFRKEAKSGKDPELKKFASEALPKLESHLESLRALEKQGKSADAANVGSR